MILLLHLYNTITITSLWHYYCIFITLLLLHLYDTTSTTIFLWHLVLNPLLLANYHSDVVPPLLLWRITTPTPECYIFYHYYFYYFRILVSQLHPGSLLLWITTVCLDHNHSLDCHDIFGLPLYLRIKQSSLWPQFPLFLVYETHIVF